MTDVPQIPDPLKRAQRIANFMDMSIRMPIIGKRFGMDFLIGLIPGVGDAIGFVISGSIIASAKQMGMPKRLLIRMTRNSAIDFGLGLIPLVGDVADMFYKANVANVRIMEKWWLSQHADQIKAGTREKLSEWRETE